MLKKQYRLKKKYQFNYTYRTGQTQGTKNLLICYTKSKNKCIKIGLSVTKKVGNAVTRNRTKRLLRVAIAPLLPNLKNNFNLIIVARSSIVGLTLLQIEKELNYCIKKAGLLREESV